MAGKGKGREGKTSAKREARRSGGETTDAIHHVAFHICPSVSPPCLPFFLPFCGTPYRLSSQSLSLFQEYNYSPSPSGENFS